MPQGISTVTPALWKKFCEHTEKGEEEYCKKKNYYNVLPRSYTRSYSQLQDLTYCGKVCWQDLNSSLDFARFLKEDDKSNVSQIEY